MISRRLAVTILVIACVPWAWLLLFQALLLILLLVVTFSGDLGACLDKAAVPTLAMAWLAVAPLPLGILAGDRRLHNLFIGAGELWR